MAIKLDRDIYTTTEIAALLNKTPQAIRARVRAGHIEATNIGKNYIITREALAAFLGKAGVEYEREN